MEQFTVLIKLVTPLGGSVDWNLEGIVIEWNRFKSLPLVGVWIEMYTVYIVGVPIAESLPLVGVWIEII